MTFSLQWKLDQVAGLVVGAPAEAKRFEHGGVVNEACTDA
jgi:hypothetical protein